MERRCALERHRGKTQRHRDTRDTQTHRLTDQSTPQAARAAEAHEVLQLAARAGVCPTIGAVNGLIAVHAEAADAAGALAAYERWCCAPMRPNRGTLDALLRACVRGRAAELSGRVWRTLLPATRRCWLPPPSSHCPCRLLLLPEAACTAHVARSALSPLPLPLPLPLPSFCRAGLPTRRRARPPVWRPAARAARSRAHGHGGRRRRQPPPGGDEGGDPPLRGGLAFISANLGESRLIAANRGSSRLTRPFEAGSERGVRWSGAACRELLRVCAEHGHEGDPSRNLLGTF